MYTESVIHLTQWWVRNQLLINRLETQPALFLVASCSSYVSLPLFRYTHEEGVVTALNWRIKLGSDVKQAIKCLGVDFFSLHIHASKLHGNFVCVLDY